MSNIYLTSLGCRLNEAELQTWAHQFSALGLGITKSQNEADLIVINTCAVTGEAARKSRQNIRKLHRQNPQAKLVVTGCYASLEKEEAGSLLGVDLIVSNQNKEQLAEKSKELLDWQSMPYAATEPNASSLFVRNRERAFVKIQDGCRYRCTYCIVTIARGEEVSRSIEDILDEINRLNQEGIQEVVIAGVHVGGYGTDIGTDLYVLVSQILAKTNIPRIRFASVEPWDLHDDFFQLFKNPRLLPHMHLPIQSGSDNILKKMSRRCKRETFLSLLKEAKKVVPHFNITSDIIVGFPGETDEDFELSKSIIKEAGFGHVHIFSFSKREGTKAASLPNQIDDATKKKRSQELHDIALTTKLHVLESMVGREELILWEGNGKRIADGVVRFFGHTKNYHKAFIDITESSSLTNQLLKCEIIGVDTDNLGLLKTKLLEKPATKATEIPVLNC